MAESDYWQRFWRRRLTRRRWLRGAALAGAGLATAAAFGCQEEAAPPAVTPGTTPTVPPAAGPWGGEVYPYDARRPFEPAPPDMTGGILRFAGFDALVFDTFDPHQSQFGPLYSGHSAVFSKLLKYVSHEDPIYEPDLAESLPEVIGDPPTEFVFRIRKNVSFHDPDTLPPELRGQTAIKDIRQRFPGLAGRQLTAEDVKFSFERQMNANSPRRELYYRASQYETIAKIETPDQFTVKITTKGPVAPFLHFMADTNAFIVPREVVEADKDKMDNEFRMIGTGPFIWGQLKDLVEARFIRNPNWFGWDDPGLGRPYLDGYQALFIVDDATRESLFRDKKIDHGTYVGNPTWVFNVKRDIPEVQLWRVPISGWVNSRFKVTCPPYDNVLLRKAIHLAADRQQVIDFVWGGEGRMQPPVGFAILKWTLPQEELKTIPGYRTGPGREEDIAEARALYEAAGRPKLEIIFADQPSYIVDFAPSFIENLRQVLGAEVRAPVVRSYVQIAQGLLRGCDQIPFFWGFDNGWIDLDDWVYPFFHTGGAKNSFGVSDPALDDLLDAQRREFNGERRRELGFQIQRYLLGMDPNGSGRPLDPPPPGAFARLDYASLIQAAVKWPYNKNHLEPWPWFGNNHWFANLWFDRNAPSFQGRP